VADLIKDGKVKHIGVSEINADQLRQANNVYPISALEIGYSLASCSSNTNFLKITLKRFPG
jgi:aryl-alcohol dehydrogenase-like predicted oxidoreductase